MDDFAQDQKKPQAPVTKADLTGKVVVVIGANGGLGFEAAKHFASMNPLKLILTSRDKQRGEDALNALKEETKFERAEMWSLELSSFASVRQFADKLSKETDRIDILVENAAVAMTNYQWTEDGWEQALQVNDLSLELLAILLLPKMFETARISDTTPRLVVVSSSVHAEVSLEGEVLQAPNLHELLSDKAYCHSQRNRYQLTKLLNIFFVRALASRIISAATKETPEILVTAVNPGFCLSGLRRNVTGDLAVRFENMEREFAFTTEEGSRHVVYPALVGLDEEKAMGKGKVNHKLQGGYASVSQIRDVSPFVRSQVGSDVQDRLWNEMVDILNKVDSRVGQIVKEYF